MFFDFDLRGDSLPPKTLCLTFDDGPGQTEAGGLGPRTAEVGHFLAEHEIAATFFVIGSHVRSHPGIVARLRAGGHLVGNHTDTHPPLVSFLRDGGDAVGEITQADRSIGSPSAHGELTFFRAPYGDWRDDARSDALEGREVYSPVAAVLNDAGLFPHLVGPVGWDIDAADWRFWQDGRSVAECGQAYLAAIEAQSKGIVLMHDSAETPALRNQNLTLDLVRWLIPVLQHQGYRFIRLDEVPAVISASRVTHQVSFGSGLDQWLTVASGSNLLRLQPGAPARFGLVPIEPDGGAERVAIRAGNGLYLARTESGLIHAEANTLEAAIAWEMSRQPSGHILLRSDRNEAIGVGSDPAAVRLVHAEDAQPISFQIEVVAHLHSPSGQFPGMELISAPSPGS